MTNVAYYRLPHEDHFVRVEQTQGQPEELLSLDRLDGREGFVIAPFAADAAHPIVLLRADKVSREGFEAPAGPACRADSHSPAVNKQVLREAYGQDFRCFHNALKAQTFSKIVLARCEEADSKAAVEPEELFLEACRCYPRMCIVLVSTVTTGTWLMATPEVLLHGNGTTWRTMALAGTMKLKAEQLHFDTPDEPQQGNDAGGRPAWSDKNMQEQRYVATYVQQCLAAFADDVDERGPYTMRAGNLVHLRSDFSFVLRDHRRIGTLLQRLHPTPAVCGLPKEQAGRFILQNEHTDRSYYSGFVGLLQPAGQTHLYVSLRCMQFLPHGYRFFAGGGLLVDSVEQQEWEETEAKMDTMRRLLGMAQAMI